MITVVSMFTSDPHVAAVNVTLGVADPAFIQMRCKAHQMVAVADCTTDMEVHNSSTGLKSAVGIALIP